MVPSSWSVSAPLSMLSLPAACVCLGAQQCQYRLVQPMAQGAGGNIKHLLWSMLQWMSQTLILLELFFTEIFTGRILFFSECFVWCLLFKLFARGVSPLRDSKRSVCVRPDMFTLLYLLVLIVLKWFSPGKSEHSNDYRCVVVWVHLTLCPNEGVLMPEAFTAVGDGSEQDAAGEHSLPSETCCCAVLLGWIAQKAKGCKRL